MITGGRHAARRLRSAGAALTTAALLLGAVALFSAAYAIVSLKVTTHTVLTGSMRGTFDPGALLITRPKPVGQVQRGDVIVFVPPGKDVSFAHRVTAIAVVAGRPAVTTQGDANPSPDGWRAVLDGDTVPHVVGHVPHVGGALLHLQTHHLRVGLLVLLGLVVTVSGTRLILGSTARDRTSSHPPHPKELSPCPSTPRHLSTRSSATLVPSPRPRSGSQPSPSPEPVSTPR